MVYLLSMEGVNVKDNNLSIEDQRSKIRQMTNAFNLIKGDCSIIKLERPLDLTGAIKKQERLYVLQDSKFANHDMNEDGYKNRKAQVDYGKTARKLSEVSQGNMSAADALRVKEKADKQREKLMEASSRASDFYNNQKKGE